MDVDMATTSFPTTEDMQTRALTTCDSLIQRMTNDVSSECSDGYRTYSYLPLNPERKEIRLLFVEADFLNDIEAPMRCRIRHVSRSEEPLAYLAISYCWGRNSPKKTIYLDGACLKVPQSAEEALRRIYSVVKAFEIPVWIDALCINQDDLTEKGHQVALMGEVYSNASKVLVWLGEQLDSTSSAIHAINTVIERYSYTTASTLQTFSQYSWKHLQRWSVDELDWEAVHTFLNSPWFSRLWPVQEVVLAKEVQLISGSQSLSWESLVRFVRLLSKYNLSPLMDAIYLDGGRGILNVGAVDQIQRGDRSLSTLLVRTLAFNVSDPLDKIYGIFGLLGSDEKSLETMNRLQPDYRITKKDLYVLATSLAMETSISLRLLRYAQVIAPAERLVIDEDSGTFVDNEGFPSWVPRYDLVRSNASGSPSMVRDRGRGADRSVLPQISFRGRDLGLLCVAGVLVSKITHSVTSSDTSRLSESTSSIPLDARTFIVTSLATLSDVIPPLWTQEFVKKLADTFTMGGSYQDTSSQTVRDLQELLWELRDEITTQYPWPLYNTSVEDIYSTQQASSRAYLDSATKHVINRATFLDSDGNLGLGQLNQRPGDDVCILFGCSVPLILRPEGDHWRLIGDAYVSGVMKGEYIEMLQQQGRLQAETREFTIH